MSLVDLDKVTKLLVGVINADEDSSFTLTVTDEKQNLNMLKAFVRLGDNDVCGLYLDNPFCAYREPFLVETAALDHGEELPSFTGQIDEATVDVIVKVAAADSAFVRSERAPSVWQINHWRRNPNNLYADVAHDAANSPLGARHFVEKRRVYFTGHECKAKLPQLTFDPESGACKADARHTSLVLARAVCHAHKEGYVSDWLFDKKNAEWQDGSKLILTEGRRVG